MVWVSPTNSRTSPVLLDLTGTKLVSGVFLRRYGRSSESSEVRGRSVVWSLTGVLRGRDTRVGPQTGWVYNREVRETSGVSSLW